MLWREIDARDLDDGLPRGFLAGAIVKVWVAHRLDWACELLGREAKNCPETSVPNADACWLMRIITADSACIAILKILFVNSVQTHKNTLIYETVNCLVGVILK